MKPELLAPAGSPASLRAAVEAGADAVYMGSLWNARMRARNFTKGELASAISYCHDKGVKAYITCNTLIFEKEMPLVADYIKYVYESGADAFIVQDLGVAAMAKEIAPDLPLHASTQLSVHNSKAAKLYKEFGFSRLILARELSIGQAKKIHENAAVDVEMFCHGALCYSYSGKCFFSLVQTGRSANRGACVQICRFPWKLFQNGKYVRSGHLTSTKDLNTLSKMPEFEKAGIGCIKIEGRLKDAAYITAVVGAYRRAIDGAQPEDLSKYTSRGYTGGFLFGNVKKGGLTNPEAPSFSGELVGKAFDIGGKGAQIKLSAELCVGDSIRTSSSGRIIEIYRMYRKGKEVKSSTDECALLIKTIRRGDSIYKVARAKIEDDVLKKYQPQGRRPSKEYAYVSRKLEFEPLPPLAYLNGEKELLETSDKAFVAPLEKITDADMRNSGRLVIDLPRVVFDDEMPEVEKRMAELAEKNPLAFMVSEPSLMSDYPSILSPYANVSNTLAVRAWQQFGNVRGAVASLEIANMKQDNEALGFADYSGYPLQLMISENDLLSELGASGNCELEDPNGNRYEITKSYGRTVVLKGKGGSPPKINVGNENRWERREKGGRPPARSFQQKASGMGFIQRRAPNRNFSPHTDAQQRRDSTPRSRDGRNRGDSNYPPRSPDNRSRGKGNYPPKKHAGGNSGDERKWQGGSRSGGMPRGESFSRKPERGRAPSSFRTAPRKSTRRRQ